jgi:hypothetical protein
MTGRRHVRLRDPKHSAVNSAGDLDRIGLDVCSRHHVTHDFALGPHQARVQRLLEFVKLPRSGFAYDCLILKNFRTP